MTSFHYILAIVVNLGFIGLTTLYFFAPDIIPEQLKTQASLITGAWISNFTMVISYFFGSSKSSADKTNLIANLNK
jgi:hypothetical protein